MRSTLSRQVGCWNNLSRPPLLSTAFQTRFGSSSRQKPPFLYQALLAQLPTLFWASDVTLPAKLRSCGVRRQN